MGLVFGLILREMDFQSIREAELALWMKTAQQWWNIAVPDAAMSSKYPCGHLRS